MAAEMLARGWRASNQGSMTAQGCLDLKKPRHGGARSSTSLDGSVPVSDHFSVRDSAVAWCGSDGGWRHQGGFETFNPTSLLSRLAGNNKCVAVEIQRGHRVTSLGVSDAAIRQGRTIGRGGGAFAWGVLLAAVGQGHLRFPQISRSPFHGLEVCALRNGE